MATSEKPSGLPFPTIRRYPVYLRAIGLKISQGELYVSSAALARELAEHGTGTIVLAHLSRQNNTPDAARRTVAAALEGTETKLLCAPESGCMELTVEAGACSVSS